MLHHKTSTTATTLTHAIHARKSWRSGISTILLGWRATRVGPGRYPQHTRADFGPEAVGGSVHMHCTSPSNKPPGRVKSRMVAEQAVPEQFFTRAAIRSTAESLATLESKTQRHWFEEQMTLPVESRRALCRERRAVEVFHAVCPTEGVTSWVTVHEEDHEEGDHQRGFVTLEHTNLKAPPEGLGSKERSTV